MTTPASAPAPVPPTHADENDSLDLPSVPVAELRGHKNGSIRIVRFTADGKYCITGASDRTVRLWNPTRIDPAYRPPPAAARGALADGIHFGQGASSDEVFSEECHGRPQKPPPPLPSALPMQTYDGKSGHIHPISSIATNASSTVLLSASDKTLLATDLVTAQLKQKFWGHVARIDYVACLGAANDDNGHRAGDDIYASASYDSTVRLWDARSRSKEPLMVLDQATDAVTCVVAGRGGDAQIVTASVDGKIRTYDLRNAQLFTEDVVHPITSFSIATDGTSIAASCLDGTIRRWGCGARTDWRRTKVFQKFRSAHKSRDCKVECAFASNDEFLVSGSECGAVAVYPADARHGEGSAAANAAAVALRRHTGATCSVAACPQPARPWLIVSASYDGSAVVWASRAHHDCCS